MCYKKNKNGCTLLAAKRDGKKKRKVQIVRTSLRPLYDCTCEDRRAYKIHAFVHNALR